MTYTRSHIMLPLIGSTTGANHADGRHRTVEFLLDGSIFRHGKKYLGKPRWILMQVAFSFSSNHESGPWTPKSSTGLRLRH